MASGHNWTRTRVDTWHDVGRTSNLNYVGTKDELWENNPFSCWFTRQREEKKEIGEPSFLPRSTEFHGSVFVGPRTKVHRIDERYAWVPEKRDFAKDQRGEISGN